MTTLDAAKASMPKPIAIPCMADEEEPAEPKFFCGQRCPQCGRPCPKARDHGAPHKCPNGHTW